jgi:hypothetical protein
MGRLALCWSCSATARPGLASGSSESGCATLFAPSTTLKIDSRLWTSCHQTAILQTRFGSCSEVCPILSDRSPSFTLERARYVASHMRFRAHAWTHWCTRTNSFNRMAWVGRNLFFWAHVMSKVSCRSTLMNVNFFLRNWRHPQVKQFIETLDAFETVWRVFDGDVQRAVDSLGSTALKRLLTIGERFPDLGDQLGFVLFPLPLSIAISAAGCSQTCPR